MGVGEEICWGGGCARRMLRGWEEATAVATLKGGPSCFQQQPCWCFLWLQIWDGIITNTSAAIAMVLGTMQLHCMQRLRRARPL